MKKTYVQCLQLGQLSILKNALSRKKPAGFTAGLTSRDFLLNEYRILNSWKVSKSLGNLMIIGA